MGTWETSRGSLNDPPPGLIVFTFKLDPGLPTPRTANLVAIPLSGAFDVRIGARQVGIKSFWARQGDHIYIRFLESSYANLKVVRRSSLQLALQDSFEVHVNRGQKRSRGNSEYQSNGNTYKYI